MRAEKSSRLRSGYECCCCCCCCCCCVCVLCTLRQSCEGGQSTPPRRVVQCVRGACCAVCVARSHSPEPRARLLFSLSAAKDKSTQNTRVACCSSLQSARRCHRCCICTLPTLRRMTLPALAAASRRHGLATRACHSSEIFIMAWCVPMRHDPWCAHMCMT